MCGPIAAPAPSNLSKKNCIKVYFIQRLRSSPAVLDQVQSQGWQARYPDPGDGSHFERLAGVGASDAIQRHIAQGRVSPQPRDNARGPHRKWWGRSPQMVGTNVGRRMNRGGVPFLLVRRSITAPQGAEGN